MINTAKELFEKYSNKDHLRNFLLGFIDIENYLDRYQLTKENLLDLWNENIYNQDSGRMLYPDHEQWRKSVIISFLDNMIDEKDRSEFENLIKEYENWIKDAS